MTKALECALRLLSRREHGAKELLVKLKQKGYDPKDSEQAVAECQRLELQSDTRFAGAVLRSRMRQGYGPQRIRQALQAKAIDPDVVDEAFQSESIDWQACALTVWQKKCPSEHDLSYMDVQKIKRFMLYRGFSSDLIKDVVAEIGVKYS